MVQQSYAVINFLYQQIISPDQKIYLFQYADMVT